jgi:WD40 repeat protein
VTNILGFTNLVPSLSFSPDGTLLASACFDKTVKLWQVPTTNLVRTLSVGSEVWSVAFSPDGASLATGSSNGVVKLWHTVDGALLRTLSGHTQAVMGVGFSSDGVNLLSAGCDGRLRVWRVSNGALLTIYDSEVLQPASLASSSAQRLFAYGRADATLLLCRWPTPQLQAWPALAGFQVQLSALTGQVYAIQTSSDLHHWSDWTNVTPTNALTLLTDSETPVPAVKFYRARAE